MRTSYTELSFEKLLNIKKAYIIINEKGNELFDNWNIDEFEKSVLGMGDITFIKDTEKCKEIKKALTVLDADFPFMDLTVQGQHYGYELFLLGQPRWGSRGAPFLWAYLSRHFSDIPLPMDENFLVSEYMKIIKEFKIPFGKDEYVYVERFAAGGMSSEMIDGIFVKEGLDMLCKHLSLY